jgi:hypothetical protein
MPVTDVIGFTIRKVIATITSTTIASVTPAKLRDNCAKEQQKKGLT